MSNRKNHKQMIEDIQNDFCASFWVKKAVKDLDACDICDAISYVKCVLRVLNVKYQDLIDDSKNLLSGLHND